MWHCDAKSNKELSWTKFVGFPATWCRWSAKKHLIRQPVLTTKCPLLEFLSPGFKRWIKECLDRTWRQQPTLFSFLYTQPAALLWYLGAIFTFSVHTAPSTEHLSTWPTQFRIILCFVSKLLKRGFLASQDALEVMLVSEWVSESVTLLNWVDWCDPGKWRYLLKTLLRGSDN